MAHEGKNDKRRDAMAACCKTWDIKQKVGGRKRKAEELAADLEERLKAAAQFMKRAKDCAPVETITGGVAGESPSHTAPPRSASNAGPNLLKRAWLVNLRDWLRGLEDSFQKTTMVKDAEKLLAWHTRRSNETRDAMALSCKHWDIKQTVKGRKRKADELAADLEERLAAEAQRMKRAQGCARVQCTCGAV